MEQDFVAGDKVSFVKQIKTLRGFRFSVREGVFVEPCLAEGYSLVKLKNGRVEAVTNIGMQKIDQDNALTEAFKSPKKV